MNRSVPTLTLALALGLAWPASAQTPVRVPFQGVLTDGTSNPITASLPMTFALYTSDTAPTALWTETQTVQVGAVFPGVYTVMLGATTSLTAELFRDNANLWVGLRVGSDPELGRFPLGATPLAAHAKTAVGAVGSGGANDPDNRYVNVDGDTMTGRLNLPAGGVAVGTSQLVVTAAGNVGIGTAAPNQRLEVSGNAKLGVTFYGNATRDWGRIDYGGGGLDNMFILYALSGNVLRLGANGAYTHMMIDTAGNVGVGTLSPAARLTVGAGNLKMESWGEAVSDTLAFGQNVTGDGVIWIPTVGTQSLQFKSASAGTAGDRITFRSSGDVGIGTTQPQAKLDVRGVARVGTQAASDNADYGLHVLRHGVAGTPGNYTSTNALLVSDMAGDGPAAYDGNGIAAIIAPRIADNDPNAHNATLLRVHNDSGSGLRVDGRGNVVIGFPLVSAGAQTRTLLVENAIGIGTATPQTYATTRLDVNGGIALNGQAVLYTDGTTIRVGDVHGGDGVRANLELDTNGGTRMFINANGQVGVNTTNPLATFHVNGGVRSDGLLDARGAVTNGAGAPVNVLTDTRLGVEDNPVGNGGAPQAPGWGAAVVFSGAPDVFANDTWGRDNSDPLWIARFNPAADETELRVVIGDNPGQAADRMVIGTMNGSGTFSKTATWQPLFSFQADGNLAIGRPTAAYRVHASGAIGADSLCIGGDCRASWPIGTSGNIEWPNDQWGGSGDDAWIRYFSQSGEDTRLEIGISNDAHDDMRLVAPDEIRLSAPNVIHEGTLQQFGNLLFQGAGAGIEWRNDMWGGGGDDAWIRYYSQDGGEDTILDIGISNDAHDDMRLYAPDAITLQSGNVYFTGVPRFSNSVEFTGAGASIEWRNDMWGGGGDDAWIRYFQDAPGEDTRLQIGISNDFHDDMQLISGGNMWLQSAGRDMSFHRYGALNTCTGGVFGAGNDAIGFDTYGDEFGGCGDAHGFTVRQRAGEEVDMIVFAENDGHDWAVGIGGGGWRSVGTGGHGGYDIAEFFLTPDRAADAGDIVAIAPGTKEEVARASVPYERGVIGVVSRAPGVYMLAGWTVTGNGLPLTKEMLAHDAEKYLDLMDGFSTPEAVEKARPFFERMAVGEAVPVALAGRVPVKVTDENGPIHIGDLITTSSKPGYGMKATKPGPTIGVALSKLDGGAGEVMVFLGRQDTTGTSAATDEKVERCEAKTAELEWQLGDMRDRLERLERVVEKAGLLR